MRIPNLTDGVVTLRAYDEDDIPGVLERSADPETQRWTTVPSPYVLDHAKTFVRHLVPDGWASDRRWELAVTAHDGETERLAGGVCLFHRGDGLVEIGYATNPWARRRGLTERAARLLLTWGFEERDVRAVDWVAARGNWPSRRLAWRLGFDIGRERHWMPHRGAPVPAWRGTLAAGEEMAPRHPWYDVPVLRGERVLLRPLEDRDRAGIVAMQSDPVLRHFSEGPRTRDPATDERGREFVEGRREMVAEGAALHWTVADAGDAAYLGHVQLFDLRHRREAELGFMAHPDVRGRGLTTEAARLALRHAFVPWEDGGLGMRRVHAFAAQGNTASRRLLERIGMTQVGSTRADTLLADGTWEGGAVYDVLATDGR